MFSVVIPLYNKEMCVKKAVASVLHQTYRNFELIIINDGSTDDSLKIIEAFDDARIKIYSKENKGVSVARNIGVKKAINPYISLLDADDWWAPTYLEEMERAIRSFPMNTLFATGRIHVYSNKEVRYKNSFLPRPDEIGVVNYFRIISKYVPAIHSSCLTFQKEYFIDKGGFKKGMHHFEDHECWLRLAVGTSLVFVNRPLSFYNKTSQKSLSQTSISSNDLDQYYKTMILIKQLLMGKERRWFIKFSQRFAIWSSLAYISSFSKKERLILFETLHQLLSKNEMLFLKTLHLTRIATGYRRIKKYKNGSG